MGMWEETNLAKVAFTRRKCGHCYSIPRHASRITQWLTLKAIGRKLVAIRYELRSSQQISFKFAWQGEPSRSNCYFFVFFSSSISPFTLTEILPAAPATSSSSPRIEVKQSPDVAISNDALAPTVAR